MKNSTIKLTIHITPETEEMTALYTVFSDKDGGTPRVVDLPIDDAMEIIKDHLQAWGDKE